MRRRKKEIKYCRMRKRKCRAIFRYVSWCLEMEKHANKTVKGRKAYHLPSKEEVSSLAPHKE